MTIYVGCSGFQYKHWRNRFYKSVGGKPSFQHYVKFFNAVELNVTFYKLVKKEVYESWDANSPENFGFVLKAPKLITQQYKLSQNCHHILDTFYENSSPLRHKIKCILWQLPPNFGASPRLLDRVEDFCYLIANKFQFSCFEFRHRSWLEPSNLEKLLELFSKFRFSLVRTDHWRYNSLGVVDSTIGGENAAYFRLHGPRGTCEGSYGEDTLAIVASYMLQSQEHSNDVFAFFNNDIGGDAPYDAVRLKKLLCLSDVKEIV